MKEEQYAEGHVPAEATRRKFLRFMGMAGVLPTAAFLEGCATPPLPPTGAKGGLKAGKDPLKGGKIIKPRYKIQPPWPGSASSVGQRMRWDFEYIIFKIENYLSKKNSSVDKVDKKWEQLVKVGDKDRNVGVNFTLKFCPAKNDPTSVGKMIIKGCMTRDSRDDTPIYNGCCDPDVAHLKHELSHSNGTKSYHVYSSSSSSLYYA